MTRHQELQVLAIVIFIAVLSFSAGVCAGIRLMPDELRAEDMVGP